MTNPCNVERCARQSFARGMCSTHYSAARHRGEIPKRQPRRHGTLHMYQAGGCRCADCRRAVQDYRKDYARRNPAKAAAKARKERIKKMYGVTPEQFDSMLAAQNGKCAICGGTPKPGFSLCIDHDHATGQVRGLLCLLCNSAIGKLHDDPELVRVALDYLLAHQAVSA
jgi:hypothetical protein